MNITTDKSSIVCAFLGFLGATIPIIIGLYLVSTMANLESLQDETYQIWTAAAATAITSMATFLGSFTILNGNPRKGGGINILGSVILVVLFAYFSEFTKPKLLGWLNPLGIVLVIPPALSGAISLMRNQKNQGK